MRSNELSINEFGFVQSFENIEAEIAPGETKDVQFPDGSMIRFKALKEDHDPTDRGSAIRVLHDHHEKGEVVTGIFYVDPNKQTFHDIANTVDKPLYQLNDAELRPAPATLTAVMERYT
jgi:2-oxoglutarate ferredoxin oxidoreductase subunit beta